MSTTSLWYAILKYWYGLTQIVMEKRPLDGRCLFYTCTTYIVVLRSLLGISYNGVANQHWITLSYNRQHIQTDRL